MAGDVGSSPTATTYNKGTPSQNVATGNPTMGTQSGMQGLGTMGDSSGIGGGKGAGNMRPQKTAMGTPIVYGNTYLPQSSLVANNPVSANTTIVDNSTNNGSGDGGSFANGTTSVPGYAYGTTSVANYAKGTPDVDEDDPWNWTKKEQVAPLAVTIKPSEAVIPQVVPDQTEQYLGNQATAMGTNAAAKGIEAAYKAYNAPLTTNAIGTMGTTASGAPVALTNAGALSAPASTSLYALNAPATIGGAVQGVGAASAAPIGAGLGASLPAVAAEGAGMAAAGSSAAASGAAMAGGEAALAAMGPVGMVIGGALLAKKLGIF